MPEHSNIGIRMKTFYEDVPKISLIRRMPVMIRVDGRSFHTFTKGFNKPFDFVLVQSMQETMQKLCENIQGCVFGYTQSDEITLILIDYQTLTTDAWFGNEVQKICSISASMATLYFNQAFSTFANSYIQNNWTKFEVSTQEIANRINAYKKALRTGAMFDSRCFNVPKEKVTNFVYWRQLDATRNSINSVGQAHFSVKEMHGKNTSQIQDMLMEKYGINWNDTPTDLKRGAACIKNYDGKWAIDRNMPILKGEDRDYVEKLIEPQEC